VKLFIRLLAMIVSYAVLAQPAKNTDDDIVTFRDAIPETFKAKLTLLLMEYF